LTARKDRFGWRNAVICGLLWGLVVVVAVTLSQPVAGLSWADFMAWSESLGIVFCATGVVWTVGCKLIEDLRRPVLLPLLAALTWLVSLGASLTPAGLMAPGDFGRVERVPLIDLAVYQLWVDLFYGGLYALGYFATRRTLRLRRRLAELRLARSLAEGELREARLQAVRGQMQPAMLLDALDALRRAYRRDPASGERLFDLLIAFLRAAMPGLRSGASTLAAELAVIQRYAALREALQTGPPAWRLNLAEPPPDLAFPPLRLLPALDRMSRATPPQAAVEVTGERCAEAFVVQIGAPAPEPLSQMVMTRLRAAMRRDLGLSAMARADLAGALVAELRIGAPQPAPFDP
jgi:hypothetical protein